MKTWNQLFVRTGWLLKEVQPQVFDCYKETKENIYLLKKCLDRVNADYKMNCDFLEMHSEPVSEAEWLEVIQYEFQGINGSYWFRPGDENIQIKNLDMYISGVVRQLNRLGFYTTMSCDGHHSRPAWVYVEKDVNVEKLMELLQTLGMSPRLIENENQKRYKVMFNQTSYEQLLDLAEKLSQFNKDSLEKGMEFIKEQLFYKLVEEALNIPGESGKENQVRNYVLEQLAPYVDNMKVDYAGNVLAEKKYGTGIGPTILLNAHLDTVYEMEKNREIVKDGIIWSSSKGLLGADDRAGVAIILQIAKQLYKSKIFNGKVKFIFTVEEEIGLLGAKQVNEYFLWGIDAAIVVDRRGTGDIVTSYEGWTPYCDKRYGEFIEEVAKTAGLEGWKTTSGGSSDTKVWASHGIQSVNLSVGYQNEHTDYETLNIAACYETTKLVLAILSKWRELKAVIREIKREPIIASIREV